jgi:ubiquinol-cytochrome c reductase iron-sulfur subunit
MTESASRRDFISFAAGGFVGVGGATALWPFVDQMNPHPGTPRLDQTFLDLDQIAPGQEITVRWNGKPVFVRHRTLAEVDRTSAVTLDHLPDPYARNAALPISALATDANRTATQYPRWLVVVGLCTHLGCVLRSVSASEGEDGIAWACPCHAARFDYSGRVRSGPARTNLPVPPHRFETPTRLRIG